MSEPLDALPAGLEALRARLATILRGLDHPPLGMGVALAEECGEVAKLLLDHHAYGKPLDRDALGGELADVLVCLCEIATLHGIDLDRAAEAKAADLAKRADKWRTELGPALAKARGEPRR
jgi:NTP pyrophosphatase (non-canonical NTP hydrolase)